MLSIALPKGRLGEQVLATLGRAGYGYRSEKGDRRLVIPDDHKDVRYFWVKPADVPVYVEQGAADVGIAGKDTLLECEPDVYELLDLGIGVCRMAVAGKQGARPDPARTLRVATKFPHIARTHFNAVSREIELIRLNGSIELAPILGMSDVIVDIVETGATLRENALELYEEIAPISARLIANKSSYRFHYQEIEHLRAILRAKEEA
ncbi:MAG: ATP phosphoribosyltransferase [Christensenellales bacterium]|jgi:ATP phosphoribosyltransferase